MKKVFKFSLHKSKIVSTTIGILSFNIFLEFFAFSLIFIFILLSGDVIPDIPTPTSVPTTESLSMKIEMCIVPGNYGRRSIAHPSINVSLVNCKPWEICMDSDSNIFGNELGYV